MGVLWDGIQFLVIAAACAFCGLLIAPWVLLLFFKSEGSLNKLFVWIKHQYMEYVTLVVCDMDMKEENPSQKVIQFPPLRDEAYLQQNILQEKETQE
jgi:hypothetical protein